MSDGGSAEDPRPAAPAVAGDPLAACTAVLVTVPYEIAKRLQAFMAAHEVPCRVRKSDVTAEHLARATLGSMSDTDVVLPRGPLGRFVKGRLTRDLAAEITVQAPALVAAYDVLVRPEDLPADTSSDPAGTDDPWARPGDRPVHPAPGGVDTASGSRAGGGDAPVPVTELLWDQAWELVATLAAAGIPAAVLEPDPSTANLPMTRRRVPVAVRPADLERARDLIEP